MLKGRDIVVVVEEERRRVVRRVVRGIGAVARWGEGGLVSGRCWLRLTEVENTAVYSQL